MGTANNSRTFNQYEKDTGRFNASKYLPRFDPNYPQAVELRSDWLGDIIPTSPQLAELLIHIQKKFKYCVDVYPIAVDVTTKCASVFAVRPHGSLIATALVAFNENASVEKYEVTSPRIQAKTPWKDYHRNSRTLPAKVEQTNPWGLYDYYERVTRQVRGASRTATLIKSLLPFSQQEIALAVLNVCVGDMRRVCDATENKLKSLTDTLDPKLLLSEFVAAFMHKEEGQPLTLPPLGYAMQKLTEYRDKYLELNQRRILEGARKAVYVLKMYGHDELVCLYELNGNSRQCGMVNYKNASEFPVEVQRAIMTVQLQEHVNDSWNGVVEGLGVTYKDTAAAFMACDEVCGAVIDVATRDAILNTQAFDVVSI